MTQGEATVAAFRKHLSARQAQLVDALSALPDVEVPDATGAMYTFVKIAGKDDSLAVAKKLVSQAGIGLAPGLSFGPESEGWLRWCYATDEIKLADGIVRLKARYHTATNLLD